jgi:hypothetical protein
MILKPNALHTLVTILAALHGVLNSIRLRRIDLRCSFRG